MPRRRLARPKQKAAAKKRKKAVADPAASASFQEFDPWQKETIADDAYVCPWNPEDDDDFDPWHKQRKRMLRIQQSCSPKAHSC